MCKTNRQPDNTRVLGALLLLVLIAPIEHRAAAATNNLIISATALHDGRISPMLFGNFIELLDDLVPGMWSEMLNDRSFEGVTRPANWCYYDGSPTICDREWETNETWVYEGAGAFNGKCSVKLEAANGRVARITQSGLGVKKGEEYLFSGYFRTDQPQAEGRIILKTLLPTGEWKVIATEKLPRLSAHWKKQSLKLRASGGTDRAVFELNFGKKGNLWADKLSLMPATNMRGWRPDVVAAVKEAHPGVLRWGGSVCDPGGYRWKNGIGDRDARVPFPNKVWGRIDSNDAGIDEFCQFCELTGAQPLICLSFSDGARSAADLVEYCNGPVDSSWGSKRAANGHAAPYNVKYWQIGNEIGGDNPAYLDGVVEFCRKMKQIDSSISCLASFPSRKLLERAGNEIAFIGPHHYTPDFAACEREFLSLGRMISEIPQCNQIKIAVTEWNISGGAWGLMRGKFLTLETALFNARYLNLLMRHSDKVKIACRSNLANSLGSGIFETTPFGLLKRPSYYVMKLYAEHAKPIPLRVDQTPEGLDTTACASENRKSVSVFIVNSKREPVEVSPAIESVSAPVKINAYAVCDTLDAIQPDVMNHWSAPDRVKIVQIPIADRVGRIPPLSASVIEIETGK